MIAVFKSAVGLNFIRAYLRPFAVFNGFVGDG